VVCSPYATIEIKEVMQERRERGDTDRREVTWVHLHPREQALDVSLLLEISQALQEENGFVQH
jgi:hypothetical protein